MPSYLEPITKKDYENLITVFNEFEDIIYSAEGYCTEDNDVAYFIITFSGNAGIRVGKDNEKSNDLLNALYNKGYGMVYANAGGQKISFAKLGYEGLPTSKLEKIKKIKFYPVAR